MSEPLIYAVMEGYHLIDKTSTNDAYGGTVKGYRVGAAFQAKVIKDSSTEAMIAEKQKSTEILTVVTKGLKLDYHDIFRRDSDHNEYFICTGREKDTESPAQSTVMLAKTTCARWEIPANTVIDEGEETNETSGGEA